jgi:hypothetical protein
MFAKSRFSFPNSVVHSLVQTRAFRHLLPGCEFFDDKRSWDQADSVCADHVIQKVRLFKGEFAQNWVIQSSSLLCAG